MANLQILALTCVNAKGRFDRPYLRISADGERRTGWDGTKMYDGDTIRLDLSTEFNERCTVALWESQGARHSLVGEAEFTPAYASYGESRSFIHRGVRHYFITYEVTEEASRPEDFEIELIRLKCNDAQQRKDYPYLKINGELVWGPEEMRTGDERALAVNRSFHRNVFVELWEEDSGGDDHFGTMEVMFGDVQDRVDQGQLRHTFRRDDGIVGDANYSLSYQLHPK